MTVSVASETRGGYKKLRVMASPKVSPETPEGYKYLFGRDGGVGKVHVSAEKVYSCPLAAKGTPLSAHMSPSSWMLSPFCWLSTVSGRYEPWEGNPFGSPDTRSLIVTNLTGRELVQSF